MDGFWTAEFGASNGMFGGGVAFFNNGKILGGDGSYYYRGEYSLDGPAFRASLLVSPFIRGAESVFKTVGRELKLNLEGTLVDASHATGQGQAEGVPNVKFGVKLTKRS